MTTQIDYPKSCPVCGHNNFSITEVLWPELILEWNLMPHQVDYINRQQGLACFDCGNNLRAMSLADAILKKYNFRGPLTDFVVSREATLLKVLEINEAGNLTTILSNLPSHLIIRYPEYDMQKIDLEPKTFDLVIHSDTLEHIPDPIKGLAECRKLLNSTGSCIYTVPIIVDRMTRSRKGLKLSYHGSNLKDELDQIVHTEFGADAWQWPILAGFTSAKIHAFEFPSALAIDCDNL